MIRKRQHFGVKKLLRLTTNEVLTFCFLFWISRPISIRSRLGTFRRLWSIRSVGFLRSILWSIGSRLGSLPSRLGLIHSSQLGSIRTISRLGSIRSSDYLYILLISWSQKFLHGWKPFRLQNLLDCRGIFIDLKSRCLGSGLGRRQRSLWWRKSNWTLCRNFLSRDIWIECCALTTMTRSSTIQRSGFILFVPMNGRGKCSVMVSSDKYQLIN